MLRRALRVARDELLSSSPRGEGAASFGAVSAPSASPWFSRCPLFSTSAPTARREKAEKGRGGQGFQGKASDAKKQKQRSSAGARSAAAAAKDEAGIQKRTFRAARRQMRQHLRHQLNAAEDRCEGDGFDGSPGEWRNISAGRSSKRRARAANVFDDVYRDVYERLVRDTARGSSRRSTRWAGGCKRWSEPKARFGFGFESGCGSTRKTKVSFDGTVHEFFFGGTVYGDERRKFRHQEPLENGRRGKRRWAQEKARVHPEEEKEDVDWRWFEEFMFSAQSRGGRQHGGGHRYQYQRVQQPQPPFGSSRQSQGRVSTVTCPNCVTLGIEPGSMLSEKVLKDSLRRQAMKWHPDRHQSVEDKAAAEVQFKRAYVAYDALLAKL